MTPRFYFDVREGVHFAPDEDGLEFPDVATAEREAATTAAEIGRDLLPKGVARSVTVEIRNQHGQRVVTANARGEWHQPGAQCLLCMIVEDEAVISIALEDEFTEAGYEVVGPYPSCAAALSSLKLRKPTVAVLDTVLKDGSCLELARELRRLAIPFVVYSGNGNHHQNAPEFKNTPWVVKPALHSDVVRAVDRLVRPAFVAREG